MNKQPFFLSILVFLCVLPNTTYAQDSPGHPTTEIAIVDVFFSAPNKILITHPDEQTEIIEINLAGKGNEIPSAQAKALRSVLQKFYDQGWEIESELFIAVGTRSMYILKRQIR